MTDWMDVVPEYDATHVSHRTVNGKGIIGHLIAGKRYPEHVRRAKRRKRKDARIGWTR